MIPYYVVYRRTLKGKFAIELFHGDKTTGTDKFQLGPVKGSDWSAGDIGHFQRISADEAKLPLDELLHRYPFVAGTEILTMTTIKETVQAAIDAQGPPVPPPQVAVAVPEPPKEPTKLSTFTKIKDVIEQKEKYNYRKARPDDPPSETNVEYDTRTVGWFVDLENGLSFHFGMDKPPVSWVKGARVKLSCELAPEGTK